MWLDWERERDVKRDRRTWADWDRWDQTEMDDRCEHIEIDMLADWDINTNILKSIDINRRKTYKYWYSV